MKISRSIRTLIPYKPGKPIAETQRELNLQQVYKLASNENALGISPKVRAAIVEALNDVHRYPDASFHDLQKAVSKYWGFSEDFLSFGNGSNEVIDVLIRIFCEPGEQILTSQYAFVAYKICAQAARVKCLEAKATKDLRFDLRAIFKKMNSKVRLVFIANPNNPTGTTATKSEWDEFLKKMKKYKNTLIVVDEAYAEYNRNPQSFSALDYVKDNRQVAVIRTFSKAYGLAGLRVGALIADPEVIDYFNRVRNPFNVNSLAQVSVIAALEDREFLKKSQSCVWQGLEYFSQELTRLKLKHYPSDANFILFETPKNVSAEKFFQSCLLRGVILRPLAPYGLHSHLRMSVGLKEENEFAINIIEGTLKAR